MSTRMVQHYSRYPITEYVLTLNGTETEIKHFKDFLRQTGIKSKVFQNTLTYNNIRQARWANQRQAYIARTYNPWDWKISVDSDEILIMNEVLFKILDNTDASYFFGFTVDMVHKDFNCGAPYEQELFHEFHRMYLLTQFVALSQKVPVARVNVTVEGAAHNVTRRFRNGKSFEKVLPLYHFKWSDGVYEKLQERYDMYHKLGISYYEESLQFCEILKHGFEDLVVKDLYSVKFSHKPDKTGGCSLQMDPNGKYEFLRY